MILLLAILMFACSGDRGESGNEDDSFGASIMVDSVDSLIVLDNGEEEPEEQTKEYSFVDSTEALDFISSQPDASAYAGGIIPVIAENVPEYAAKLMTQLEKYSSFIVVDKASMRVILYDSYGQVKKAYDMACSKNYGTKHKKADSRTPEGFFSLEGKYDSTDWLFTDDNGHTSQKKGQFGPRFLRIKTPISMQIGIHGTCSPWSIGHRTSHGCIRIKNEEILELYGLAEVGCPVIVLPGKRDRAVNREEGYNIPYFPTNEKYAMTAKEADMKVNTDKKQTDSDTSGSPTPSDSVEHKVHETDPMESKTEKPTEHNTENPADTVSNIYF